MSLPAQPLSAVDAISPAINRARQQLFDPLRPGFWWRMAVLAFFTGEVSGGGGINFPSGSFDWPKQPEPQDPSHFLGAPWDWNAVMQALPWILALALLATVFLLIFLYVHSVLRFVLFDSVITGQCSLRQGWTRWRGNGAQYFLWLMIFQFFAFLALMVLVGIPLLVAWQQGVFRAPREHMPMLITGGLILFLVLFVFGLVVAAIAVLAKDFVVPIMALEGVTVIEGWRRLLARMNGNKGSYAGYLGMKLVLVIAVGIATAMINVVLALIVIIPAGIVVFILIALKQVAAIALAILIAIVALISLFALFAIVAAPVAVFFQAYALYFFGSRYDRLAELLQPPPPPPPPASEPLEPAPVPA
jgi:hypothetical protein